MLNKFIDFYFILFFFYIINRKRPYLLYTPVWMTDWFAGRCQKKQKVFNREQDEWPFNMKERTIFKPDEKTAVVLT